MPSNKANLASLNALISVACSPSSDRATLLPNMPNPIPRNSRALLIILTSSSCALDYGGPIGLIVVVVIVGGAQAAGLRVHFDLAVCAVLRRDRFEISTVAHDLYI